MKKKIFRSVLLCIMAFALALGVAACGDKPVDPTPDPDPQPPTPAVTRYATDARAKTYGVYTEDGDKQEEFNDLYKAIAYCVENGDEGDYVAKLSGDDKDVKLFIQKEVYSGQSSDQFWYYENGTSLDRYTPWQSDYHTDLGSVSKNDLVVMNTANGLETYRHGYEIVSVGGTGAAQGGVLATWNVYPFYDANIQVDIYKYMGITKADYTIKLTEAKVYPTYEGYQKTYAHIGFINPDSNNVAQYGLACDVNTGNWYYYYGNADTGLTHDAADETAGIIYDTSKVVLTSTWHEDGGYYTPDKDVKLTGEIVTLTDDGSPYYVDRLTADFGEGDVFTHDFEQAAMTACATMRFTAGINIWNENGMPLYDNGAKFENLKITSAIGTVYQEIADDPEKYGGNSSGLDAGTYDLLNSNPASAARFHTVLYNRAVIDYNFDTAGQDIYSFSFRMSENQPAYSSTIRNVKDKIAAIPAVDALVAADEDAKVVPARNAYNALVKPYQADFITQAEVDKLVAAENACLQFHMQGGVDGVLAVASRIKTIAKNENSYTSISSLKEDAEKIATGYDMIDDLSASDKEVANVAAAITKITEAHDALARLEALNLADTFDYTYVNAILEAASTNLWGAYVDSETFTGVCTLDESIKIYNIVSKGWSTDAHTASDDEKAVIAAIDGGIIAWAIEHRDGEYTKLDKISAMTHGVETETWVTGSKEAGLNNLEGAELKAKLDQIAEIFNTLDAPTVYVFRTATILADGKGWLYNNPNSYRHFATNWATLTNKIEGYYKLDGSKLVSVDEETPDAPTTDPDDPERGINFAKIDKIIELANALEYTAGTRQSASYANGKSYILVEQGQESTVDADKLAEVIEWFNSLNEKGSDFFRQAIYNGAPNVQDIKVKYDISDELWAKYTGDSTSASYVATAWNHLNEAMIGHYERCGYYLYTYAVYSGVYQPLYRNVIGTKADYESNAEKLTADADNINDIYAKYTALSEEEKACVPAAYVTRLTEVYQLLHANDAN